MAIFPHLEVEAIVQVSDKTRLDATKTFITQDESDITKVEIEPEASSGYIDVTGTSSADWYLDWVYTGSTRTVTVTVRVTTDGTPVTKSQTLSVKAVADDILFASDSDLIVHEPDILKWVKTGRNSFIDVHRRIRDLILDWFAEKGYVDINGDPLTITAFVEFADIKEWAIFMTLRIIMESQSNASDDVFTKKATLYAVKEKQARNRFIRLDLDGDLIADTNEGARISSGSLFVR